MKKVVLITGSGMVAQHLSKRLLKKGYTIRFLSRRKRGENYFLWDTMHNHIDRDAFKGVSHIVHLAGKSVAQTRWTTRTKHEIINSRIHAAQLILDTLKSENIKIESFISASATGYYGSKTTKKNYVETDECGNDFLSDVCVQWEGVADAFAHTETAHRVIKLRIGVVLSINGGALLTLSRLIRYYVGAVLGTGKQYMPWIHIDDLCGIIAYAIENNAIHGVFNAVAPEHVTHETVIRSIARTMHRPLFWPNIPSFILRLWLGEAAAPLLYGSKVSSKKIIDSGFTFNYPNINKSLESMCLS